jgi:hypothetical protein
MKAGQAKRVNLVPDRAFEPFGRGWAVGGTLYEDYARLAMENLGVSNLADVYPVADNYEIDAYNKIPAALRKNFRATNARAFTEQIFGKKNYRKDLLKATASTKDAEILPIAMAFVGLVPIDWIINFLRVNADQLNRQVYTARINPLNRQVYTARINPKELRRVLGGLDTRSYRHILGQPLSVQGKYFIADTISLTRRRNVEAGGLLVRNFDQMHDELVGPNRYASERIVFEDVDIVLNSLAKKLDGMAAGKYTIYPAHHTSEMLEWGNHMHNCIAGYRSAAVAGQGIYGAIKDGDVTVANFEIRGNTLNQLLGVCNQTLPNTVREPVEKALVSAGVNVDSYWGKN